MNSEQSTRHIHDAPQDMVKDDAATTRTCATCQKTFRTRILYICHTKKKVPCGELPKLKGWHRAIQHKQKRPYKKKRLYDSCPRCKKYYKDVDSHMQTNKCKSWEDWKILVTCKTCDKQFARPYLLRKHLEDGWCPTLPRICNHCGKAFRNKIGLIAHMRNYVQKATNMTEQTFEAEGKVDHTTKG